MHDETSVENLRPASAKILRLPLDGPAQMLVNRVRRPPVMQPARIRTVRIPRGADRAQIEHANPAKRPGAELAARYRFIPTFRT